MTDAADTPGRTPEKPTEEWVTGDEPMTGPQESYLHTLAREAGVEVPDGLTKAQASEMIDHLQDVTGRGAEDHTSATVEAGQSGQHAGPTAHDVAQRVEDEGIADQQAMFVDDDPGAD